MYSLYGQGGEGAGGQGGWENDIITATLHTNFCSSSSG